MIIGVNSVSNYSKFINTNKKNYVKNKNITFESSSSNVMRKAGMAIAAATLLYSTSCIFPKRSSSNDVISVKSISEKTDSSYISIGEYHYKNNQVRINYHYFPTDNNIDAESYNWSETIYPDGRIEKDSMGYAISITPEGKRTVVKTEQDEYGNLKVATEFPDGTKIVRIDYNTDMPKEILYEETSFWSNGNKKEHNYFNEYPINKEEPDGEKIIEKSVYKYNENGVLLMWESNELDSMRSKDNNKYDKKGRLIYDDLKNEKYEYKFNSKKPFRATSEIEGCKRIKLFNQNGSIKKEYFKAKDGTITNINNQ